MNKKIILGAIAAVAMLGLIVLINNQSHNEDNVVKIGAVIPLSGFGAYWGEPVSRGIELAKDDLEEKYGKGSIIIIVEDGAGLPKNSISATRKLIDVDKVDAIYAEFSNVADAISPILKAEKIPFVHSTFNRNIVDDNPYSIKSFILYSDVCREINRGILNDRSKVAIVSEFVDSAPTCISELSNIKDENLLVYENLPENNDFRSLLLQIKEFNPDYIIQMTFEGKSLSLIKQKNDLNINTPMFCMRQDCLTDSIIENIGIENLEGSISFESDINQSFVDRYKRRFNINREEDIEPAAIAYQSIYSLVENIFKCDNDTSCVVEEFNNFNSDEGALRETSFRDRIMQPNLIFYEIINGNKIKINI